MFLAGKNLIEFEFIVIFWQFIARFYLNLRSLWQSSWHDINIQKLLKSLRKWELWRRISPVYIDINWLSKNYKWSTNYVSFWLFQILTFWQRWSNSIWFPRIFARKIWLIISIKPTVGIYSFSWQKGYHLDPLDFKWNGYVRF